MHHLSSHFCISYKIIFQIIEQCFKSLRGTLSDENNKIVIVIINSCLNYIQILWKLLLLLMRIFIKPNGMGLLLHSVFVVIG